MLWFHRHIGSFKSTEIAIRLIVRGTNPPETPKVNTGEVTEGASIIAGAATRILDVAHTPPELSTARGAWF